MKNFRAAKVKRLAAKKTNDFVRITFPVVPDYTFYDGRDIDPCAGCPQFGKGPCHCTLPYLYSVDYNCSLRNTALVN